MTALRLQTRRRAFSLIELLIVVALMGILVGFGGLMYDSIVLEAEEVRVQRTLREVQKAFNRHGQGSALVPDTAQSPNETQRAGLILPVNALMPRHFEAVPLDAWGNEVYRFGNYVISNGYDGIAGTIDDIYLPVIVLAPIVDDGTGTALASGPHQEAILQAGAIGLEVNRYVAQFGAAPVTLSDMFKELEHASPPDPWGINYYLDGDYIGSAGPDSVLHNDDDVRVHWVTSSIIEDHFVAGIHDWIRAFPSGIRGTSDRGTPVVFPPDSVLASAFDPGRRVMRFVGRGSGVGGSQAAVWVKLPQPAFQPVQGPKIRATFEVDRVSNAVGVEIGVVGYYQGSNTGVIAGLRLDNGDSQMHVAYGAPNGNVASLIPRGGGFEPVGTNVSATGSLTVELSFPINPPRVSIQVSGSFGNANAIEPLDRVSIASFIHGVYYRGIGGGGAIVDVTEFRVSP